MNESREAAKNTMRTKYGVNYGLQSPALRAKHVQTMKIKYGVDNIQKIPEVAKRSAASRESAWIKKVKQNFPLKLADPGSCPHFRINEDAMQVFMLREEASIEFLKHYGFRIAPKFAKKHFSVGLVQDGILYQVLRFERKNDHIVLADFGTRFGYVNPNGYAKLLDTALRIIDLDSFSASIPRNVATPEVINSLRLHRESEGFYEVYWITENGLKRLTRRHNIAEMKKEYDYITSDYIDSYCYT